VDVQAVAHEPEGVGEIRPIVDLDAVCDEPWLLQVQIRAPRATRAAAAGRSTSCVSISMSVLRSRSVLASRENVYGPGSSPTSLSSAAKDARSNASSPRTTECE
jgi:hypothetical protein